jgi:rhodanese-related sulfurtransferase
MKSVVARALLLLFASVGLGLIGNALSPRGLSLRTPPARAVAADEFIPLPQARELWDSGEALFLDARDPADYATGHLANAFNLPGLSFDRHFGDIAPMLTPESPMVIYCDGVDCDLSHKVRDRLRQLGFAKAKILFNGWTVWREAGLPIATGTAN